MGTIERDFALKIVHFSWVILPFNGLPFCKLTSYGKWTTYRLFTYKKILIFQFAMLVCQRVRKF